MTTPRRLPRALGVVFGVAVAVGSMIGAGILRAPADVAARLPTPAFFLGIWVVGGAYALLGANALAELGAMRPVSGGQYVLARRAFGPFAGFVVGWNDWLSTCGAVAAIAFVFGEALGALVPALAGRAAWTGAAAVVVTTALLLRGTRAGDRAQRLTSALKAAALLGLVAACVAWVLSHGRVATAVAPPLPAGLSLLAAGVVALQGVIFSYDGWTGALYFAEELHDPGRELPRAMFGGVLSVMALYLMINGAFLLVLPLAAMARSTLPAADVAAVVFPRAGASVVQLVVVLALPSALLANSLMASRVAFAMGRDMPALGWLARADRRDTPTSSIVTGGATTVAFLLTGTFERVVALCAFLFVASYAVSFAAVFVMRAREPDAPRPWRAIGHPWSTGLVLAASLAFLGGVVAADVANGLIALGLVVLAYPAYRLLEPRRY